MQNTTNYNLNKPDGNDFAKIQALNDNADIIDATLKSLADISIDFEYQIPTIVGAQLQLTKNSDTKRLFVRLNNALNGNVTVSLDGGATSRPLFDVDGNQVTQLDKGFVEVVEDTNFFTLRNRGVSATDLRELIDIVNEAERNESVLKGQFAEAVNEVDLYGGINLPTDATWANILAEIPNIDNGKVWASGSISVPYFASGRTQNVEVNGVGFKASILIILGISGDRYLLSTFHKPFEDIVMSFNKTFSEVALQIDSNPNINISMQAGISEYQIDDDGFVLTLNNATYSNGILNWYALE